MLEPCWQQQARLRYSDCIHDMPQEASGDDPIVYITIALPQSLVERLDALPKEFGLRSRGAIVARLLQHLFNPATDD